MDTRDPKVTSAWPNSWALIFLSEVLISETNHPTIYFLTKIEELEVSAFHAGPAQFPKSMPSKKYPLGRSAGTRRKLKLIRLGHNTPQARERRGSGPASSKHANYAAL
ncbi:hypothetical protein EVAR_95649_1 [Eumeta japonica]|uniref:Uncharacterized protein n=1 Tax=Eumeta variegata TaxID=151549 RepID=A0A4C1VK40_EUMVA|nr:hypothetical protein EVAR_95649_1 [Eumeta japonica]